LCGSSTPAATGVQTPGAEGRAQLRQAPVQASAQQTPSTQKFDKQSVAAPHGWPLVRLPQLPLIHTLPPTQSSLLVQRLTHALSAQRKGSQFCTPGIRQLPRPLHVPAVFSRSPAHAGGTHTVSARKRAQPPIPSQAPVVPQVLGACTAQMPRGSGLLVSTGQHVPSRPGWLQVRQAPAHATLQHSPSAQKPDAHSLPLLQTAPRGLGPQLPATHCTPLTQSEAAAQVDTHLLVAASQPNGAQMVAGPGLQRPWPSQTLTSLTESL
jgi:hypothetical protein